MTYIACQNPNCKQTYPITNYKDGETNISCKTCGGVVIDKDGCGNLLLFKNQQTVIKIDVAKNNQEHHQIIRLKQKLSKLEDDIQSLTYTVLHETPTLSENELDSVVGSINEQIRDLEALKQTLTD